MSPLHDFLVSQIRTYVPIGAGALISYASLRGVDLDAQTQGLIITTATALVTALYYTVARLIEMKWPKAGRWLLGSQKKPTYTVGDNIPGGAGISPALTDGDTYQ